ncbi:hypothetical protein ASG43_19070 [Aureimonas sp. Leaf454]|nr:hypothetical protein ASG43_19070 [Aureimonas sp. Leaf454]
MNAPAHHIEREPLDALGWNAFFADQITPDDASLEPARISRVHRSRLIALSAAAVEGARLFQVAP